MTPGAGGMQPTPGLTANMPPPPGFDESSPRQTVRAWRIFCSNRQARRGCGRTVSVWIADKIRRLSLTTGGLWRFLQRAVVGGIRAAIRAADGQRSDRTWQRLWKRFAQPGQRFARQAQTEDVGVLLGVQFSR